MGLCLGHLGHGDASDDPRITRQSVLKLRIQRRPFREVAVRALAPAAGQQATVQRSDHVANDKRLHVNSPDIKSFGSVCSRRALSVNSIDSLRAGAESTCAFAI